MRKFYKLLIGSILLLPQLNYGQTSLQLFNGTNLNGWYAFEAENGKHISASDLFSVEDSTIRLYGKQPGYLMSEQSFTNFKLTVEFKWNTDTTFARKSNNMNSGVMYLVPTETPDTLWPKGIQFQIKKGATGDFVLLHEVTLLVNDTLTQPGRSVVIKHTKDAWNTIGEWNTIVVSVNDGFVTQSLNGQLVNEGSQASVNEGRILLQYEGFPIDFRKVEIEY